MGELVFPFVVDHYGQEIQEFNWSLLVLVDLCTFNSNQFVALIWCEMKHALRLNKMNDHLDVISLEKGQ